MVPIPANWARHAACDSHKKSTVPDWRKVLFTMFSSTPANGLIIQRGPSSEEEYICHVSSLIAFEYALLMALGTIRSVSYSELSLLLTAPFLCIRWYRHHCPRPRAANTDRLVTNRYANKPAGGDNPSSRTAAATTTLPLACTPLQTLDASASHSTAQSPMSYRGSSHRSNGKFVSCQAKPRSPSTRRRTTVRRISLVSRRTVSRQDRSLRISARSSVFALKSRS